jgi:hypothetical protein
LIDCFLCGPGLKRLNPWDGRQSHSGVELMIFGMAETGNLGGPDLREAVEVQDGGWEEGRNWQGGVMSEVACFGGQKLLPKFEVTRQSARAPDAKFAE